MRESVHIYFQIIECCIVAVPAGYRRHAPINEIHLKKRS
ncbi:hypothetical protein COPEUT_01788 [Coprococcus eutactus ATCC 27759]|nr:hypothetical protein COPEUT_01788 [Coprococcus eutactus ATCC 27759]